MKKISLTLILLVTIIVFTMMLTTVGCTTKTEDTTTTTTAATTTTIKTTTTTTTLLPEKTDAALEFSDAELAKGVKITTDKIRFGVPLTIKNAAFALDKKVKYLRHHGEYWGAWNWGDVRTGVKNPNEEGTMGFYYITGKNVFAMDEIAKSKFVSTTEGAIWDSWGNGAKYEFGLKICDGNGDQLPDAGNGGTVANWIAKLSTDTTKWAIKDKDFGGTTDTVNAEIALEDFGVTPALPKFSEIDFGIGAGFTNPQWKPESFKLVKSSDGLTLTGEFDLEKDKVVDFGVASDNSWKVKYTMPTEDPIPENTKTTLTYNGAKNIFFKPGSTKKYTFEVTVDDKNKPVDKAVVSITIK